MDGDDHMGMLREMIARLSQQQTALINDHQVALSRVTKEKDALAAKLQAMTAGNPAMFGKGMALSRASHEPEGDESTADERRASDEYNQAARKVRYACPSLKTSRCGVVAHAPAACARRSARPVVASVRGQGTNAARPLGQDRVSGAHRSPSPGSSPGPLRTMRCRLPRPACLSRAAAMGLSRRLPRPGATGATRRGRPCTARTTWTRSPPPARPPDRSPTAPQPAPPCT